jgi:NAD(P)H-dependent FMN reductase
MLLIVHGATRPNNKSQRAVKFIEKLLKTNYSNIEYKVVTPNDFELKFDDDKSPEYYDLVQKAQALLIISPEYNHSFPGKLKTLIDSEFKVYENKPVLIAGASDGQFGGARMVESLVHVLKACGMQIQRKDILFPRVHELLDEEGNCNDAEHEKRALDVLSIFLNKYMI